MVGGTLRRRWAVPAWFGALLLVGTVLGAGTLAGTAAAQTAPGPGASGPQNVEAQIPACGSPGNAPPPSGPAQLSVNQVSVTGSVTVLAGGFVPGAAVELRFVSPPTATVAVPLGSARADSRGSVRQAVTLPPGSRAGSFAILVYGQGAAQGCLALRTDPGAAVVQAIAVPRGFVLARTTLSPGQSTSATGDGCPAGAPVVFALDAGGLAVGQDRADAQGHFTGTITIPRSATLGAHTVSATCGDLVQVQPVTIVARPASVLPLTGAEILRLLALSGALVLAGTALIVAGRRRWVRSS